MIPSAIYRSVAAIHDAVTGKLLGTGFLVTDRGDVLTAKHVVAGCAACKVCFGTREVATVDVVLGPDDWAVVRLAEPPKGLQRIPLAQLPPTSGRVRWSTAGYARLRGVECGSLHGEIRADTGHELDLFCEELQAASIEDAQGLSGAPCLVDGAAVAVITDVLHRHSTRAVIASQAMALPVQRIASSPSIVPGIELVECGAPLPWEAHFRSAMKTLTDDGCETAAKAAGLVLPHGSTWLSRQVARRMIHGGIEVVARVLGSIGADLVAERRDELLALAENLWVEGLAADGLADALTANRAAVIAATKHKTADHHLHRAAGIRDAGVGSWPSVHVAAPHEEPFVARLVEATTEALCERMNADDADELRFMLTRDPPITAFVHSEPRPDVVARLRQELPGLRIVFVSRATPKEPPSDVDQILPIASESIERRAHAINKHAVACVTEARR